MSDDATSPMPADGAAKAAWRRWAAARRRALADADPQRRVERALAGHLSAWAPWRRARVALVYLAFGSELDPLAGGLRPGAVGGVADAATTASAAAAAAPAAAAPDAAAPDAAAPLPLLVTTRTPPDGGELRAHALAWNALERHPLGFLQPRADAPEVPLERIDLVLVPGLCFDRRGARLGYGRGYYDRLLPRLPERAVTVGVVHDALVLPRVPREPHDALVHFLASESGVRATDA